MDLNERRAILAHSLSVYRRHCEEFARSEALPHNHTLHPWWYVHRRVLSAPAEFHAIRYNQFLNDRKKFKTNHPDYFER